MARRSRRQEVLALMGKYRAQGISSKAFCAEHDIPISTFHYWKSRVAREPLRTRVSQTQPSALPFLPVTLAASSPLPLQNCDCFISRHSSCRIPDHTIRVFSRDIPTIKLSIGEPPAS